MGHNPRGCEKIPGLLRWPPNRGWRRCKSTKVCHDWASCSSLHSPILAQVLTLSRLASHVWPVFYKSGPRYGRGISSQPPTFAFTSIGTHDVPDSILLRGAFRFFGIKAVKKSPDRSQPPFVKMARNKAGQT